MGIQEIYEDLRNRRDRRTENNINRIIENEYFKISDEITKFWDWNEEMRVYNSFVIAAYLEKKKRLKTAQIRKFLDKFKAIQNRYKLNKSDFNPDKIIQLRPLLAYAAGRNKNQVLPLVKVLDPLIPNIKNYSNFEKFFKFLEAIVAFHKFLGGD